MACMLYQKCFFVYLFVILFCFVLFCCCCRCCFVLFCFCLFVCLFCFLGFLFLFVCFLLFVRLFVCLFYFGWNVWKDFRLSMSALETATRKSFTDLLHKLTFRSGILCYHCWCWHRKSKVFPYIIMLYDKYLDHMLVKLEQNRIVETTQNLELFDKKND